MVVYCRLNCYRPSTWCKPVIAIGGTGAADQTRGTSQNLQPSIADVSENFVDEPGTNL